MMVTNSAPRSCKTKTSVGGHELSMIRNRENVQRTATAFDSKINVSSFALLSSMMLKRGSSFWYTRKPLLKDMSETTCSLSLSLSGHTSANFLLQRCKHRLMDLSIKAPSGRGYLLNEASLLCCIGYSSDSNVG